MSDRPTAPSPGDSAAVAEPTSSADPDAIDPALKRLAAVVTIGAIMAILDTTIVTVAIDTLGRDFKTSLSTISWVSTAYLLALAVVIPLTGWTVERFGATRMWLVSLTLFTLGSVLCGVAWSAGSLILFRVLQGLGGGMIMPLCMTLLARAAGPRRIGRIMSVIGVPALVAPVLGPVVGGLIVDHLSWRWIFFVNVPIGIVAVVAALRVLPRDDRGTSEHRLDVPGVLLISPGLAALVYGLSEAGSHGGFGAARVQIGVVVGLLLLVAFVMQALRSSHPLLDMRLFRNRTFAASSVTTFIIGAALFGAMFLLPLYYQVVRGQSALNAGLLMAPQGLGAMLMMPLSGRVTDRRGAGRVVPAGMLTMLVGTLIYTQLDGHTNEVALVAFLFVRGLGLGLTMMPAMSAAYQTLDPTAVPRATTTLNILQRVGGSLATALVAVEVQRGIAHRLPGASGGDLNSIASRKLPEPVANAVGAAFGATFWWIVGLTAVGFVSALFLPRQGIAALEAAEATPVPEDIRPAPADVQPVLAGVQPVPVAVQPVESLSPAAPEQVQPELAQPARTPGG